MEWLAVEALNFRSTCTSATITSVHVENSRLHLQQLLSGLSEARVHPSPDSVGCKPRAALSPHQYLVAGRWRSCVAICHSGFRGEMVGLQAGVRGWSDFWEVVRLLGGGQTSGRWSDFWEVVRLRGSKAAAAAGQ